MASMPDLTLSWSSDWMKPSFFDTETLLQLAQKPTLLR
jgi:hypothetical protein